MSYKERPFVCVAEDCQACDEHDEGDDYACGFRAGYHAARDRHAAERAAIAKREAVVNATERTTRREMAEQEERHRRTLDVMDAEVARLTALVAAAEEEEERRKWSSKWADE